MPPERKRWPAALLGLLQVGLGHLYAGRPARAVTFAVTLTLLGAAAVAAMYLPLPKPINVILPIGLVFGIFIGSVVDAYRCAAGSQQVRWFQRWVVLVPTLLLSIGVVQPTVVNAIRTYVGRGWAVTSIAMEPTLLLGDHVMAAPANSGVERGSLAVFEWPGSMGLLALMRIVGVPGDTLRMAEGILLINGDPESPVRLADGPDNGHSSMGWQLENMSTNSAASYTPTRDNWGPLVVPPDHYFAMGDNRANSLDSRYRGFVERDGIRGLPKVVYYSRSETGQWRLGRIGVSPR